MISRDELEQCLGQFIYINSFFLLVLIINKLFHFLISLTSQIIFKEYYFEINADPKMVTTKPFAHISEHSEFHDESDMIFMLSSIFHFQVLIIMMQIKYGSFE